MATAPVARRMDTGSIGKEIPNKPMLLKNKE
jgi:hypothetical protein